MKNKNILKWLPAFSGVMGAGLVLGTMILLLGQCWKNNGFYDKNIPSDQAQSVKIYLYNLKDEKLVSRTIQIHKDTAFQEKISEIIKKMGEKAKKEGGELVWPLILEVRSAYLRKNGLLILDFEKSVQYNQSNCTLDELASIYSVLQTITTIFTDVKEVKILVGGQETETLAGHVDISYPLGKDSVRW